jgi:hypothetical protein
MVTYEVFSFSPKSNDHARGDGCTDDEMWSEDKK